MRIKIFYLTKINDLTFDRYDSPAITIAYEYSKQEEDCNLNFLETKNSGASVIH